MLMESCDVPSTWSTAHHEALLLRIMFYILERKSTKGKCEYPKANQDRYIPVIDGVKIKAKCFLCVVLHRFVVERHRGIARDRLAAVIFGCPFWTVRQLS
mmetsp:Transcript_6013/g.9381  ORF Transcript_6013/g.9381 Transcript_6013/m.9381 type:complete len:100 (-) Transcript_6013:4180-4479(-)